MSDKYGSCALVVGALASVGSVGLVSGTADAAVVTYIGQSVPHEGASLTSFVDLEDGQIARIGVRFDASIFGTLTDDAFSVNLALPALPMSTLASPMNHVSIDYNPMGHPAPGVYDVPHFDFHFYALTQAERQQLTGPDFESRALVDPGPEYRPAGYTAPMAPVPFMGAHIEPEHEDHFDETFLYGSYDGYIAFFEPMITNAYFGDLENGVTSNLLKDIPLPAKWNLRSGEVVPTVYEISYDDGVFTVALLDFVVVPEPASLGLLGVGTVLLLGRRRK